MAPKISVVSPVYRAEKIVDELVRQLSAQLATISDDYEIILVEDGSPDASWSRIEENARRDPRVKGIKLSRNFGQHYAITAGLDASQGEHVVVMDCDLQDNPVYIPALFAEAQKGFDIVYTSKSARSHSTFKNLTARIYAVVFNFLSDSHLMRNDIGAYSMLNRRVVDAFCSIRDVHRHYLLVLQLLGFSSTTISIEHNQRFEGKSSYSFSRLLRLAIDGITSQSDKLLRLSISLGFVIFILATFWAFWLVVSYFIRGSQPGYTSIMAMLSLSTGLILMSIGIMGLYIGKIFEQVKGRPLYWIEKSVNFSKPPAAV